MPEHWIEPHFDENGDFVEGYFTLVPDPPPQRSSKPPMTVEEIKAALKDVADKDIDAFIESLGRHVSKEYNDRIRREKADSDAKVSDLTTKYEDAIKFKTEAEKAKLAEEGKLKELLEAEKNERAAEAKKNEKVLKDMKQGLIRTEALRVAKDKGIIAEELVDVIDLSKAEYADGKFAGVAEAVEAHQKAKPHLFKAPETDDEKKARETREAEEAKRKGILAPPAGGGGGNGKVDWSKATPQDFEAERQRLMSGGSNIKPMG